MAQQVQQCGGDLAKDVWDISGYAAMGYGCPRRRYSWISGTIDGLALLVWIAAWVRAPRYRWISSGVAPKLALASRPPVGQPNIVSIRPKKDFQIREIHGLARVIFRSPLLASLVHFGFAI